MGGNSKSCIKSVLAIPTADHMGRSKQLLVSSSRYSPTALVLAISEVDDNQVGKFSFHTKEAILKVNYFISKKKTRVKLSSLLMQPFKNPNI